MPSLGQEMGCCKLSYGHGIGVLEFPYKTPVLFTSDMFLLVFFFQKKMAKRKKTHIVIKNAPPNNFNVLRGDFVVEICKKPLQYAMKIG